MGARRRRIPAAPRAHGDPFARDRRKDGRMSATPTAAPRSAPFWKQRKWEERIAFWVFMAPMLIGLGLFTFTPIVWGFLISLSDARNTTSISEFVGFANYADMLRDDEFRKSLRTGVIFTAFIVP